MKILKSIFKSVRDLWLIIGVALLMFAAIEVVFFLFFQFKDSRSRGQEDARYKADTYQGEQWVSSYFKEFNESGVVNWRPYVYLRRAPHRGQHINVDPEGIRLTVGSPINPPDETLKISMFGGSTMWGAGARDHFTIPSLTLAALQKRGYQCHVINYGQSGYVSTQEIIELKLQLQRGEIPDLVVFYDGVNDTFSAYQQGEAGLPQNEFNRKKEFNLLQKNELITLGLNRAANKFSTVRFLKGVIQKGGDQREAASAERAGKDNRQLASHVIDVYLGNLKLVDSLAQTYGFKYIFYWQPVIFFKSGLTEYEKGEAETKDLPGLKEFYRETYSQMKNRAPGLKKNFHDISLIFDGLQEPLFIDWMHLGEKGNALVAERMAADLATLIDSKSQNRQAGNSVRD